MLGSSWAEQDLWAIFQLLVSQEDQSLFSLLPRPTGAIRRFLHLSQEDTAKMQEQHKVEPSGTGCSGSRVPRPCPSSVGNACLRERRGRFCEASLIRASSPWHAQASNTIGLNCPLSTSHRSWRTAPPGTVFLSLIQIITQETLTRLFWRQGVFDASMSNGFVIYLKITILLLQNVHKQMSRTLTPPITRLQIHYNRLSLPLSPSLSNSISYLHVFFLISGSHFLLDLSKFLQVGIIFIIRKIPNILKQIAQSCCCTCLMDRQVSCAAQSWEQESIWPPNVLHHPDTSEKPSPRVRVQLSPLASLSIFHQLCDFHHTLNPFAPQFPRLPNTGKNSFEINK